VDLPNALDEVRSPGLGAIGDFHDLLGGDQFREFLTEVIDAFETESHPGARARVQRPAARALAHCVHD